MRFAWLLFAACAWGAGRDPGNIVVDASQFYDRMPAGDSTAAAGVSLFDNVALSLVSKEDAVAEIAVPQAGEYRLFVRSQGVAGSSFRVAVNGKTGETLFGDGAMSWKRGDTFHLERGIAEVRLTSISPRPMLNVLVLTKSGVFYYNYLTAY